jgi:hypothetical protein
MIRLLDAGRGLRVRKKTTIVFVILLSFLGLLHGGCYGAIQGSGEIISQSFDYDDFTRVEVSSAFKVDIEYGDAYNVNVTADDNLFEYIRVSEYDGVLKINMLPGHTIFPNVLTATVTMPDIYRVDAFSASEVKVSTFKLFHDFHAVSSGASTIEFVDLIAGDVMLEADTASRIQGSLKVADMELEASSVSRITLSGQANNINMSVSGASNMDLGGVVAKNVTAGLSGGSSAEINITGRLDAGLSGASHILYTGDPEIGNINLSDICSVERK